MTGKEDKTIDDIKFEMVHKQAKLELELAKYKRAFEILKDKGIVEISKRTNLGSFIYQTYGYDRYLEKEEYELLEELMSDGKI